MKKEYKIKEVFNENAKTIQEKIRAALVIIKSVKAAHPVLILFIEVTIIGITKPKFVNMSCKFFV